MPGILGDCTTRTPVAASDVCAGVSAAGDAGTGPGAAAHATASGAAHTLASHARPGRILQQDSERRRHRAQAPGLQVLRLRFC